MDRRRAGNDLAAASSLFAKAAVRSSVDGAAGTGNGPAAAPSLFVKAAVRPSVDGAAASRHRPRPTLGTRLSVSVLQQANL